MNLKQGWYLGAALAALAPAAPTAAEDSTIEQILVVGARLPLPAQDVAATVDIISRDELLESLVVRTSDMVRYIPGVSLSQGGTRFGDSDFTIRGLSGNRVMQLIDGIPVALEVGPRPIEAATAKRGDDGAELAAAEHRDQVRRIHGVAPHDAGTEGLRRAGIRCGPRQNYDIVAPGAEQPDDLEPRGSCAANHQDRTRPGRGRHRAEQGLRPVRFNAGDQNPGDQRQEQAKEDCQLRIFHSVLSRR